MQKIKNPVKTVDGIFDKVSGTDEQEYASVSVRSAIGLVLDIEETLGGREKVLTVLKLRTDRGAGEVEFPRGLALSDRANILNQNVRYSEEKWASSMEGTSSGYSLEVLTGPLANGKLIARKSI